MLEMLKAFLKMPQATVSPILTGNKAGANLALPKTIRLGTITLLQFVAHYQTK
jgi:hypothetical protein